MIPTPNCNQCSLALTRKNIVSSFGPLPAEVLLVTDSPNRTDEMFNRPLAGPDAKLFREMLTEASGIVRRTIPTLHIVSITLCRPHESNFDRPPKTSEILNCMENILHIKDSCSPKLIVLMGDAAKNYYLKEFEDPICLQPCWFIRKHPGYWINAVSSLAEGLRKC